MKVIHTADWHLGALLNGVDRTEDHEYFLSQLLDIINTRQPDALIVSGDVFDTNRPLPAVSKILERFLVALTDRNHDITVVLAAGNHDAGLHFEIGSEIWKRHKVFTIGRVAMGADSELTPDLLDSMILELPGRGWIAAVPFIHPVHIPKEFRKKLMERISERNTGGWPVIATGHLAVAGCNTAGHSQTTERMVGGLEKTDSKLLGGGFDYMALGHIHHPQFVAGSGGRIRYSGSPIMINFDETYPHSVSVVSIPSRGESPVVEEVPIHSGRHLYTMGGPQGMSWKEMQNLLKRELGYPLRLSQKEIQQAQTEAERKFGRPDATKRNIPGGSLVKINVCLESDERLAPGAERDAEEMLRTAGCTLCIFNVVRREIEQAAQSRSLSMQELKTIDIMDLADQSYRAMGKDFTPPLRQRMLKAISMTEKRYPEN